MMKFPKKYFILLLIVSVTSLESCRTYYQRNQQFNSYFEQGNFKAAQEKLASDKKAEKRRTKLLYYMNMGVVEQLQGNYQQSNEFLEKAHITIEDFRANPLDIAASFLTNPTLTEYRGEDVEVLLVYYYKALNYLMLNDKENALVECKRMDIKLQQLNDKYKQNSKFQKDAFIHLFMGIVYDANGDYNNAFIAYRNALNVYKEEYQKMFGIKVPEQLKKDILRTAHLAGFFNELNEFEAEFGAKYANTNEKGSDLVFFWNNALGPVKVEWGIDFIIVKGAGGLVHFRNDALGLNFAFPFSDSDYNSSGLGSLKVMRVAFPKYLERPAKYYSATLKSSATSVKLDKAEDVNAIAFKTLEQRMLEELGKSLLRLALKKSAEYAVRKENQDIGAVVGILNALTEKADTRNWQTIPHDIQYCRMPLQEGRQEVSLTTENGTNSRSYNFTYDVKPRQTYFQIFQTVDFLPPLYPTNAYGY